jgi:Flp pilus assembly protein TadG
MRQWRRFRRVLRAEDGTASLEFVTAGMILLLPMVYLVLTMSALQAGSLAVEGAARQAVRVYVQAPDTRNAEAEAERAIRFALADYGLDPSAASISISCSPRPAYCLRRRATVTITVGVSVGLPLVPPALTVGGPLTVAVRSTATEQVSRFWGAGL